jgi:hypothetical protein
LYGRIAPCTVAIAVVGVAPANRHGDSAIGVPFAHFQKQAAASLPPHCLAISLR